MAGVDFYFDYLSPYAYFASLALPSLCEARGIDLGYRPVLFAGLLDHWGQRGPAEIPPKAFHTFRECLRYAALRDIPFRAPRFHPFVPLTALRVSLADVAGSEQRTVVDALFAAGWGEGRDLGSAEAIEAALSAQGLDGRGLVARAGEADAKAALREGTARAVERGVFGVPTMLVGPELFWGVDSLAYLELFLDGADPLQGLDLARVASQGPAAARPASLRPPAGPRHGGSRDAAD